MPLLQGMGLTAGAGVVTLCLWECASGQVVQHGILMSGPSGVSKRKHKCDSGHANEGSAWKLNLLALAVLRVHPSHLVAKMLGFAGRKEGCG